MSVIVALLMTIGGTIVLSWIAFALQLTSWYSLSALMVGGGLLLTVAVCTVINAID